MSNHQSIGNSVWGLLLAIGIVLAARPVGADLAPADSPLFLGNNGTPLALLVMGRDHKLFYEAYNDASDLNQDGVVDVGYKPDLQQGGKPLDYYGYFDSHKCYSYSGGVFTPTSVTLTKKCSNAWSGDFLNYLTTSRIDALRRVLYGGRRSTDSATETVLERARIPQDAHSWGKEYESIARDGYDIGEYAPLSLPTTGTRHLFANTTLSSAGDPLLRVLTNSRFRIWEWVSIERPVAGDQCAIGANNRTACANAAGQYDGYPNNSGEFSALVAQFANAGHLQSTSNISTIDKSNDTADYYLTVITGTLKVTAAGTYELSVDGDDAVEVIVDGKVVAGWYGGHSKCGTTVDCRDAHKGSLVLSAGNHTLEFHHQEKDGNDNYFLYWKGPDSNNQWQIVPSSGFNGQLVQKVYDVKIPASLRTDYVVRVKACVDGLLESECKGYPADNPTVYKPTGLLHDYGEPDRMAFGLLTGSFKKNLSGGILRKNISSFKDEINPNTGQFIVPTDGGSIRKAIDSLAVAGFDYASFSYTDGGCSVPMVDAMQEGRCAMWGNPIAEMMYEGVRYFAGKTGPTSAFDFSNGGTLDESLGLPKPDWKNPYRDTADGGYLQCSKPFEVVISDIPSYDTEQVPGNFFTSASGDLSPALDAAGLGQTIWNGENEGSRVFIGQSGNTYDGAPTPKDVSSFGNIRGLSPEEPTKQGGYYAASVAYYAKTHDLNAANGDQKMDTFAVALSSPLPRIEMPMENKQIITLVPFAKSVGGCSVGANYKPTNTIVDFYVESIANTGPGNQNLSINGGRPYGKFRINYEDSEYGSDHDMDAIVTYEIMRNADNTLTVKLSSDYAAGCIIQHMGYVISGTTKDGVYLEVRDLDTSEDADKAADYFLDTPSTFQGVPPAPATGTGTWDDDQALPLTASRTFTPGSSSAVFIKHDPLWYAAKWGGFVEDKKDSNDLPDKQSEWDVDNDGKPDTYFYVTNAGKLKEQLGGTFEEILARTSSAAAVAVNTGSLGTGSRVYQARFKSSDWSGELLAYEVDPKNGTLSTVLWDAGLVLSGQDFDSGREILTYKPSSGTGIPFRWPSNPNSPGATELDATQIAALNGTDNKGGARLQFLRGSRLDEGPTTTNKLRKRGTTVLGDIVNSNPYYVGPPTFLYPNNADFPGYADFRLAQKGRKPVIYVGANDGMLHGFDALTGKELLGYVPSQVFDNLRELTKPAYSHRYFVDESAIAGDVRFSDGTWHTVLIGGLRAGGKGFFALDITDPSQFDESNADKLVLWERTAKDYGMAGDFSELGFSFSRPSIVRMHNGKWAAVFGNGYSNSEKAVLFIVDIENGSLIKKIDTGAAGAVPNGLSTPTVIDKDGDFIADYIYAGDLQGHLWRFDVSSTNTGSWTSSLLYTATDTTGKAQPIASAPEVTRHPLQGVIVLFGTGKYFEKADVTNKDQQTFYGIWDNNGATVSGRSYLQQQTFAATSTVIDQKSFRMSSQNPVDWNTQKGWYIDLKNPGERVVGDPLMIGSRIVFTSNLPDADPCGFGGTSWLNVLDAVTGGRAKATFLRAGGNSPGSLIQDVNGDSPSSLEMTGVASAPNVMNAANAESGAQFNIYTSTSEGTVEYTPIAGMGEIGRQTWRQVEF